MFDTVYLLRMKELAKDHLIIESNLETITTQLVQLVKNGHEIHPHIHPHWLDAEYDATLNQWNLEKKRYYTFYISVK